MECARLHPPVIFSTPANQLLVLGAGGGPAQHEDAVVLLQDD